MQGLWLQEQTLHWRSDLTVPPIPAGWALVRVRKAGICSTDLELLRGYYPYTGVPGHEFVGEILQAPDNPARVGQRVVGEINVVCGNCSACRNQRSTHCENRKTLGIHALDGAFAEYLALPLANLHQVPDSVSDEAAVFTEPLAAALEIQEQVQIQPGMRVLVVGAGRLGQLVAQTLALTGCELLVVARHARQRELLQTRWIDTIEEDQIPLRCMDLVVEATGSPAGFTAARRAIRPRGVLVLKSTYHGETAINLSSIVVDEITLIGSRCGPFAPALRLLEKQWIDPTRLIDAIYPLQQGTHAFDAARQPGVLKVLLEMGK
jgi:threonine dehydrogenase-like Zn-dependent dehydrogenase